MLLHYNVRIILLGMGVVKVNSFTERIKYELNEQQYRFATSDSRYILTIAGPGSGKTRSLTYRVANLVESGVDPARILLMTFTNKAAEEIRSRVGVMLGQVPNGMVAGTFHSVGARFLRKYASYLNRSSNFGILDDADSQDLLKAAFSDVTAELALTDSERKFLSLTAIKSIYSDIKNRNSTFDEVFWNYLYLQDFKEIIRDTIRSYERKKVQSNLFDFDDLIHGWLMVFQSQPDVEKRFSEQFEHVLVDEYQDTNITQAEVVRRIANYTNLAVVGDDAQSIYQFTGAEVGNILNFAKNFDESRVEIIKLEENYRSTPQIIALANASITHNQNQHQKELFTRNHSGEIPLFVESLNQATEAEWVGSKIVELTHDYGVPLKEIAVLYRSSFMNNAIELELTRRRIPYQVFGGIKFLESAHIKDTLAWLKILHNDQDELAWRRVLLLQPGIGQAALKNIWEQIVSSTDTSPLSPAFSPPKLSERAQRSWEYTIRTLKDISESYSVGDMIEGTLTDSYIAHLQKKYKDGAGERIKGIQRLADYAATFTSLERFLEAVSLDGSQVTTDAEAETENDDFVTLSTIHSAKGKEWDNVFLIGLNEGSFPSDVDLQDEEEARRLFFVAVTRPRERLYMTRPIEEFKHGSLRIPPESRFVTEVLDYCRQEEHVMEERHSWL